jgi:tetratricopeptide (TPR) repeat protein
MASILSTLASVEIHVGEYGKAEQNIQRAIATRQQFFRDHDTELVAYYTTLGVVLCARGKCKQANEIVEQALRLCETSYVECQTGIATARTTLGAINVNRKRYSEAEVWYRGALDLLAAAYGPSNAMLVPVLAELASLYASRNRYAEAEAAGRHSLEIAAKELSDSDEAAKAALAVGQSLAGQGRLENAEPYFKQSLAIHERAQGPETIEYAMAMQQYARFLRRAKRSSEASVIEMRANTLLNRAGQKVDISELPITRTSH